MGAAAVLTKQQQHQHQQQHHQLTKQQRHQATTTPTSKRRLRALTLHMANSLLNADWRASQLQHHCVGCCQSREHCIQKVSKCLARVARGLRVSMLCKNNWSDWPNHMMWFGVLGHCHGLLRAVLLKTLSPWTQILEREVAEDEHEGVNHGNLGDDVMVAKRRERAKSMSAGLEFLRIGDWEQQLYMLRVALAPQVKLMAKTLKADSREAELQDIHTCLEQGNRDFNVVRLCQGDHTKPMLRDCHQQLHSGDLWSEFPCTEQHQSNILRACSRSAAFVWRLLVLRMSMMPFALFGLLRHRTEQMATQLLSTPLCQRDAWSRKFLEEYNTPRLLLSERCHQLLAAAAFFLRTSTFFVERCHSQNSRLARRRVQTH